ncbi:gliding motility-associated C-terminal domain-containing protein [Pontibacter sp. BT310]|uniref:Gliding motility-associated C-terminal domain-containing protein n=1 Tax=Pontibacter populi TaxID=890055 RepID=A0ABS6XDH8_9BACT|nr:MULTISPECIES: gliding motility-associated C-terminal domain-containing protein [Pontibacter]MBJ6119103.1 gliding motility-associated C-terminal domain-containing protein [Pontibacter sp. BT310]MBR0571531.1 gliding motility-associated C-terminal domain-containing protein [Microvirga sp. STS03]MBW3365957.1 gliding motility-associated C-terminal domain-containing protein [Pontibacter populi]
MQPFFKGRLLPFLVLFLGMWFNSAAAQDCKPVISTPDGTSLCSGTAVVLQSSEAKTYTWSTGETTASISITKPGSYWVKTTTTDGCEATSETITIAGAPDANIIDPEYENLNFTYCSYAGNTSNFKFTLNIQNTSITKETNKEYLINWGDGKTDTYGKNFETASHTYTASGGYDITLTVTGENGCTTTTVKRMFVGSNPGLGISSDGNNTQCAPATYRFKITGVEGNSPETVYTFQFDDGTPAITYKHNELPADRYIEHTFNESSKDTEFGFTLTGFAKNPCSSSRATFSGIRISKGPEADFAIAGGESLCINQPVNLQNLTKSGYDATNNTENYLSEWSIEPATGWNFVSGTANSKSPKIVFTKPGKYKLILVVKPLDPNTTCARSSKEMEITVSEPPKANFTLQPASSDNCTPTSFKTQNTSTGDGVGYKWEVSPAKGWGFASGSSATSEHPEFNFTDAGDYAIKLTATNKCAPASVKEEKITIRSKPVVKLPANAVYCGPQTIAFTTDNAAHKPTYDAKSGAITGYRWTVSGNNTTEFTSGTSTSANPTIKFTEAGIYTVSVVALNECGESEPATQQVRIDALPELKAIAATPNMCLGGSTTITVSGADTYTWTPADGLSTTTGNTVTAKPTKTTTYTITGKNSATGCSSTTSVTVIVNEPPKVEVKADVTEICVGQGQAILTATGADRYEWSPAIGLSATTGASVTATPAQTTTYMVTGFDDNTGCSTSKQITIKVNPLPVVSAGADIIVCNKPVVNKLQGSPVGGNWSGEHVTADGTFTPPSQTGNYTLTYTYTDPKGCSNYSTMQVTVNEAPVADAGQDVTVCLNSGSFNLTANLPGGKWSGSELVTASGKFTPSKAGTFTLTYSFGEGSCATSDQVTVTVNELPKAPVVATPAILCPGFGTTLQVQNPVGKLAWYDAATGGKLLGEGATFETPALQATTTYYVETTIEGGCTSVRTAVKVTVRPATPAPTVAPVTLCGPGSGATLVAQGNATIYQWFDVAEGGTMLYQGRSFGIAAVNESKTYYVQAVIEGCISPRTAATITVLDVISDNTIKAVTEICAGESPAKLEGSTPIGGGSNYSYYWEISTVSATEGFSKVEGATAKNYQPGALSVPTWFRRVATSGVCSHVSEPVRVSVTPVIANNTVTEDATYCIGTEVAQLKGSEPAGGTKTYSYLWEMSTNGENGTYTAATGTNTEQHYKPGAIEETTWFRRKVTSGTCQVNISQPVKITIYKPISKNTIVGEQTVCANAIPQVLEGRQPENGDGNYSYRWYMSTDGENFTLATGQNSGINYAVGALTKTTWFKREVKGGPCGASISNTIKIHVNPVIANNIISKDQVICFGAEATMLSGNQLTGGDENYSYRWLVSTTGADGAYTLAAGKNNEPNYTPGQVATTTWYKREVLSGTCVDVSPAIEITVVPLPIAPAVAPVTICENTKATLAVTASGNYNWYTTADATTPVYSGRNFETPALTATTTYYVETVNANGCGSSERTAVTVTVNQNIKNNNLIAPTKVICAGQIPDAISGIRPEGGNILGITYRWEKKTEGVDAEFKTIVNATSETYQPTALTKTTWFRRVAISGPCAENVSEAVKVAVLPVLENNTLTIAEAICEGETPKLLTGSAPTGGDGAYTYSWSFSENGTLFTEIPNSDVKDFQPGKLTKTTWYKRTVISGPCTQIESAAIQVIVHPAIVANTITPTETIVCAGSKPGIINGSKHAGGISAFTYLWEVSTDGVNYTTAPGVNSNQSYQPTALTESAWFRRKVTSGKCFDLSAAVKINVNPVISENTITEEQMVCVGSAPALLKGSAPTGGDGIYSYEWQSATSNTPAAFAPITSNGKGVNYQPGVLSTTTYFRRVVTSGACSHVSNVVKVTVSPQITKNTITIDQTIYAGQRPSPLTGSLPAGGDNTYTYLWEVSTNGNNYTTATGLNDGRNYSPGVLNADTWYRRRVYSGGCESISNPVKITITLGISNNNIQADQVICYGNTPKPLKGSTPEGGEGDYIYQWQYKTSDAGTTWVSAKGTSNGIDYAPPALTQDTWFRRVVISGPRTDNSQEVMITVKPAMSNNKISTNQTICYATAPSTLTGSTPAGGSGSYTYLWEYSTESADKGFTTAPGANNGQNYNPMPLTQKTWFRRIVTSESCDGLVSNVVVVSINAQPLAPVAQSVITCSGSSVTLKATGKEGRLEWYASASSGEVLAVGNTFTTPVLTHTTTYYVQEVTSSCASDRTPVKVTVMEPSADAGPDRTIIKGRSITLEASGGDSYSWSPAASLNNPNIANPVATPEKTTTYIVTITTAGGCTFTDEVTVTVLPFVEIPNTFTPNRDGINDTWEIANLKKYPNCKVQVFNQWGTMVFQSNGYQAPWDGRYNGQELPLATYYYVIQLEPSEKPLTGSITIVK